MKDTKHEKGRSIFVQTFGRFSLMANVNRRRRSGLIVFVNKYNSIQCDLLVVLILKSPSESNKLLKFERQFYLVALYVAISKVSK